MKKMIPYSISIIILLIIQSGILTAEELFLLCGAAFKKPMEELIPEFKEKTNIIVNATYSGSGALFSQVLFTKKGDLFIIPDTDVMNNAKEKNNVIAETITGFGYIAPVINVQKGNPKHITGLNDLTQKGLKIAIGNPKTVFIGSIAAEIIDKNLSTEQRELLRKNIVVYTTDFSKLTFLLQLKQVDAIIGFHYLENWFPDKIENIKFRPDELFRIGAGQAAVLSYSKNKESALKFIAFLTAEPGQEIFKKYYYFSTKKEIDAWIGADKPVSGNYTIPDYWFEK